MPNADWIPLILTALTSGTISSIITTYGTQTRERRRARTAARAAIRHTQTLTLGQPTHAEITTALDTLETAAMLAGLPRTLTTLHREAHTRAWVIQNANYTNDPAALQAQRTGEHLACTRIARQAAELLTHATWHPWTTAPHRWYRTRRLTHLLDLAMPDHTRINQKINRLIQEWERDIRQQRKQAQNDTRAVPRP